MNHLILKKLYSSKKLERKSTISSLLKKNEIDFIIDEFNLGANFYTIIPGLDPKCLILSAHWDGPGAFDNAASVYLLINLLKKLRGILLPYKIWICFFDCEEIGQMGSKSFINRILPRKINDYNKLLGHLELDGCGIGNSLLLMKNITHLKLGIQNTFFKFPIKTDGYIFIKKNIQSIRIFTLPLNEAEELTNSSIFPASWFIPHSPSDTASKIQSSSLNVVHKFLLALLTNKSKLDDLYSTKNAKMLKLECCDV